MRTAQQNKNLSDWLNIHWPAVPKELVISNLNDWSDSQTAEDCGTVCCFGGWVARNPEAQAQGVYIYKYGAPHMLRRRDGELLDAWDTSIEFFGVDGLFDQRKFNLSAPGRPHPDKFLPPDATDHEVVLNRLRFCVERPELERL